MDNSHKSPATACSGGRVHTLQHQNMLEIARNFAQNPRPTRRFEILRLLNLGAQGLGLTRAERTYLFFLVDKTQERDWSDGAPIVWWSVQRLADSLGVSARQVNRLETSLIAKGFLTHQDSANHRRWGIRDKTTGKILEAYGVNLAPLSALYDTWKTQWETQQSTYLVLKQLKARIGALRRRLRGDLAGQETTTPSSLADQVSALQARCETLPPTKSLTSLEEAKRVFQELHALTQETQALWQPSLFPPRVPQETPGETPSAPASETTSAGQKTSKNVLLGGRKRPTHRKEQLKQKKTYVADANQMEQAGEQEKREKERPPTPRQVEPSPTMTPEEEKTAAQEILTPERLAVLLLADQAPETWNELLAAVNGRIQTQAEDLSERT